MVTTRYSNQQGSKSRQNPCFCQVQPPENRTSESYRRQDNVFAAYKLQSPLSGVQHVKQSLVECRITCLRVTLRELEKLSVLLLVTFFGVLASIS